MSHIVNAWERAARGYWACLESDVGALRRRRPSLLPVEIELLGDLRECRRAVHLQCSHGQDALSLWLLGAREVVGVDISREMLAIAAEKGRRLSAAARWVRGDVASLEVASIGSADLVFTGKGALPWVRDVHRWAAAITDILLPGGRLVLYEQHPLTWVWDPAATEHRPRSDGGDYFYAGTRPSGEYAQWPSNSTHPADSRELPRERQWTLGQIVSALASAGLRLVSLTEYPEHFWDQFPRIPGHRARRLPNTFSIVAVKQ